MEIDFIQELKKRDELLDGYLRQIEIQEDVYKRQPLGLPVEPEV